MTRATTLALGFFVIFELLWDVVPLAVVFVVEGFSLPTEMPDWVFSVMQVSPSSAYFSTVVALLPELADTVGADPVQNGAGLENGATESGSFFHSPEIGILVLGFWLIVPLVIGYYTFYGSDL